MKKVPLDRILWALVLVSVGGILLAYNLDLVDYNAREIIPKLWPLFIIIPGITSLVQQRWIWGGALLIGGSTLLLSNFTDIDMWKFVWPLLIITFGLSLLFKPNWSGAITKGISEDDYLSDDAVFGGIERSLTSKKFKGGEVNAVFGGAKIDLRKVELADDEVTIDVNAIFGGVEILVDTKKYKVIAKGSGVFGAWTSTFAQSTLTKPVLVITGAAVFGGVDIK